MTGRTLLLDCTMGVITTLTVVVINLVVTQVVSGTIGHLVVSHGVSTAITSFLSTLIHCNVVTFALVTTLKHINMRATSIVTMLNTTNLTINLTLRKSLSGLTTNILLIVFHPFHTKRCISLNNMTNAILDIRVFSAAVHATSNGVVIVPGNGVVTKGVVGFSHRPIHHGRFVVNITCSSSVSRIGRVLAGVVRSRSHVLGSHRVAIHLGRLNTSSVGFIIHI